MRPLLHIVFGIEETEDRSRSPHRLLEAVVEIRKFAHRIVQLEQQEDKRTEQPHRHAAVQDFVAADEQERGDRHGANRIHQGRTDRLDAHVAQIGAKEPLGGALETQYLPYFRIEGLYDPIAGNGFVQNVLNLRQLVLPGAGSRAHFPADLPCRRNHHGNEQYERPAQMSSEPNHENNSNNKGKKLLQELANHRTERELHSIHVVDECRKNGSRGVLMEEARRPAQRGLVEMIPQVGYHPQPCVIHQVSAQIVAETLEKSGSNDGGSHHDVVVMHVDEGRDEGAKVEMPSVIAKSKNDGAFRSAGLKHLVEDWLQQQNAKCVEGANRSQQDNTQHPLK